MNTFSITYTDGKQHKEIVQVEVRVMDGHVVMVRVDTNEVLSITTPTQEK